MKTRILNLLLPVLALTAAACGDSFEFGTPTHDLDEGTDLSAGTTQVLWKNKGAVYPTKRIHNFRIPGLVRTPHKLIAFCEAREETGSTNKDGGDIDALTGATVTSRAVTRAVNAALAYAGEVQK